MWTRVTGQPEEELLISLWENPAENAMEAGSMFPAVGQEQQRPEKHPRRARNRHCVSWDPS
jgi:hypothetical protein